jgi:hypothetical protein
MMRNLLRISALVAIVGLAACSEEKLAVTNPNSGDTKRVLGTPLDAENLIGTYYKRWSAGVYGTSVDIQGMANMFSLMNYSSLANSSQNSHAPFAGASNSNTPGNVAQGEQLRLYSFEGEVNRVASSFLAQMKGGLTLGSPARDLRARAFSEMLRGLSLGYVALMHDSLAVVTEAMDPADPGNLVDYKTAMDSAMAAFDRAITAATTPAAGTDGFPLPATWIPSPTTFTAAEFVKLIRSYRARFRANVARTPAERAAVNWDAVIADAQNGFTADHLITTSTTQGPGNEWRAQYMSFSTWHQMPPFIIGMADTSGSYAAWTAQPLGDRGSGNVSFLMATPDLRFPQGSTRAAQQADFAITQCQAASTPCKRYFVNRIGTDRNEGLGWGWSNYDFVRFYSWFRSGDGTAQNGNTPFFVKAELDMLQAEGLYRKGQFAAAAALVNVTRVKNGLPAITAFDATSPVPGTSTTCIPKIPVGPTFKTLGCGNLWEALKYEKRIETAYTTYSPWYLDGRGWGDLPETSPLFWATPFQDLLARGKAISDIYGTGLGTGNAPNSTAGKSTYGW